MTKTFLPVLFSSIWLSAGCSEEPAPRTVEEYLDNPQFLEASVVRCARNRSQTRYDAECVNARQAVSMIEAREERSRRDKLEAQSENKREALRRTHHVASEARQRAAEIIRLQEEAEYLAQFGEFPITVDASENDLDVNVRGTSTLTTDSSVYGATPNVIFDEPAPAPQIDDSVPASDGGNAPGATTEPKSTN